MMPPVIKNIHAPFAQNGRQRLIEYKAISGTVKAAGPAAIPGMRNSAVPFNFPSCRHQHKTIMILSALRPESGCFSINFGAV
jgi:hypothetical protein